jgi:hypothetical protein
MRYYFLCFILLLFYCCSEREPTKIGIPIHYLDLPQYLDSLSLQLQNKSKIKSTVIVNNELKDTALVFEPNFNELFSQFYSFNINKPALKGKYSVFKNDTILKYQALNDELEVRYLTYYFKNNSIAKIEGLKQVKNVLHHSKIVVQFNPNHYYIVQNENKSLIGDVEKYNFEVQFIDK